MEDCPTSHLRSQAKKFLQRISLSKHKTWRAEWGEYIFRLKILSQLQ